MSDEEVTGSEDDGEGYVDGEDDDEIEVPAIDEDD
jgi:hypothetical protein